MSIFAIACAAITLFTIKHEPQYVRVTEPPLPEITESADLSDAFAAAERININTATSEELQTVQFIRVPKYVLLPPCMHVKSVRVKF